MRNTGPTNHTPTTPPGRYAFQGLGEAGPRILAEAREQTGLPIMTEVRRSGRSVYAKSPPIHHGQKPTGLPIMTEVRRSGCSMHAGSPPIHHGQKPTGVRG
nr:hypothetical protein [Acrocarpospora macrocephala]